MKLFVWHTPELTPNDGLPNTAVVIDVLRATTTIATALHVGAEAVQAFSDMEKLFSQSEHWAVDKRLRAGERGAAKVEGCDLALVECVPYCNFFCSVRWIMWNAPPLSLIRCVTLSR